MRVLTRRGLLKAAAATPFLGVVAACGVGSSPSKNAGAGSTAGSTAEPVTAVTITSTGLSFDITTVHARSGTPLTVTYRNEHTGIPHNWHVSGAVDAQTTVKPGPDTQTITVTFPAPGDYKYICDVHPEMMVGVVRVS